MFLLLACLLQDPGVVAREVENANSLLRPQLQQQAIERLKGRGGSEVAEAVLAFVEKKGRGSLTFRFIEALGSLKDERIVKLLRDLAVDDKFAGRLIAIRALTEQGDRALLGTFRKGLRHQSFRVRAAMAEALGMMGDQESIPEMRGLLNDESCDVRSQAAEALYAMGDASGLPVLVEALGIEAKWFDEADYGQLAREEAFRFLRTLTGDDFGFKPWDSEDERAPGKARFDQWMARKDPAWKEKIPPNARRRPATSDYRFGYEALSCKVGTCFLRIGQDWTLTIGNLNLVKVKLSDPEIERLKKALQKALLAEKDVFYGEFGCDFEKFYLKVGNGFEVTRVGLVGRPDFLDPLAKILEDVVPPHLDADSLQEFKSLLSLFRKGE